MLSILLAISLFVLVTITSNHWFRNTDSDIADSFEHSSLAHSMKDAVVQTEASSHTQLDTIIHMELAHSMKDAVIQTEASSHTQLDTIIQRGDMESLKAFFNSKDNHVNLHEAIRLACQFRQCKILHYLDSMVRSGDGIMKKMLEDAVKNETVTETERCKIVECLLLCVKERGTLSSKLVSWAIQHSSLDIVIILLFNKRSSHIDLNAYDDEPSPIMACFRRQNLCEARQILRNLWERTLHQPCNVKTETLQHAILTWGQNDRPLHSGQGLTKTQQKSLLTDITEIDVQREILSSRPERGMEPNS